MTLVKFLTTTGATVYLSPRHIVSLLGAWGDTTEVELVGGGSYTVDAPVATVKDALVRVVA